ncbi:MAG: DUF1939 domain-containing protein [Verrucomicrobia bacterium]|nr:DUF1939 domain-containing protein [Verrucomicrobiota bacterium]
MKPKNTMDTSASERTSRLSTSRRSAARLLIRSLLCVVMLLASPIVSADPANGRVVLQAFWWNYWNNNYPADYATYLADLAPRLRGAGIDAVWIPPSIKNKNATGSVGYSPFDQYDLGDKWQGGAVATRLGTKDALLRAIAILHANGIEVIQDVVWNHMDGAGSQTGAGGEDPAAPSNRYKNFRNVSYATPAGDESAADYLKRKGRFPKNWQNFHPNPDHNTEADPITAGWFGPDICYYRNATGKSGNASYNPAQAPDYMREGMRNWTVWMKKQTGVDGLRLDAVKHFETWAAKDFLWNVAFNSGFASRGADLFVVGEYVGGAQELDAWVDAVNNSDGFTDIAGTFDFPLRGALKSLTDASGFFDLGSLPAAEQQRRTRVVNFVNNHDTFRPLLDGQGRIIGWDSGNEIGGHIDPNDPRIQAAYAAAFAVDGSPCVFFEDLFDLHSTGRRWSHSPTNEIQLPMRDYLRNLIWCHEHLRFKEGAYRVRWQAQDLLVIERERRAIVGINDHFSSWQTATVQTSFSPGERLHDYSGAHAEDAVVDGSGRATLSVPPCDGSNLRRGYAVWGPSSPPAFLPAADMATTQEWEMADDLGDSHPNSLRQGGALPAQSTQPRNVGRVFPAKGFPLVVDVYPSRSDAALTLEISDEAGHVAQQTGTNTFSIRYTPSSSTYHSLSIRNAKSSNPSQKAYVKVAYHAPADRSALPPSLTTQPENLGVLAGHDARFSCQAEGTSPLLYQWRKDGTNIAAAEAQTLVLHAVTLGAAGQYNVVASNAG